MGERPGTGKRIDCKFLTMHTELVITVDTDLTGNYLVDRYRIAELRWRYWSHRNPEGNLVARRQMTNCQLLMQKIWEELERRAEQFPTAALMLLIETGNSFSMNLNPRP